MQTYSYLPSRIDASLTFGGHQIIRDQPDSLFQSRDIFREIGLWEKIPWFSMNLVLFMKISWLSIAGKDILANLIPS